MIRTSKKINKKFIGLINLPFEVTKKLQESFLVNKVRNPSPLARSCLKIVEYILRFLALVAVIIGTSFLGLTLFTLFVALALPVVSLVILGVGIHNLYKSCKQITGKKEELSRSYMFSKYFISCCRYLP